MRILYVCHRVPFPPKRGGKIRPFNMISHLAQEHEVTVASLARSRAEEAEAQGLRDHCHDLICERVSPIGASLRMLATLPGRTPFSMGYFGSPRLGKRISEFLATHEVDLIFVHCSSVAQYVSEVQGIPRILDFGDMDSQKWQIYGRIRRFPMTLAYRLEGWKLEREERRLAGKFDICTCTTRAEFETLNDYDTGAATDWFPNGVDSEAFKPGSGGYDPDLISFIGRMDYYPNQEAMFRFCRRTLPMVQARRPDARLVIVGANPSSAIRRLGELPGVTVTGSVPDVQPYVEQSAVNVAPLRIARGTQNKILESMAMGVPVVTTSIAAKGVDAVPGEHLVCADTPEEEASRILAIMENAMERDRLAEAGRARVLSHHSWPNSMVRLDAIIERCLKMSRSAHDNPRTAVEASL